MDAGEAAGKMWLLTGAEGRPLMPWDAGRGSVMESLSSMCPHGRVAYAILDFPGACSPKLSWRDTSLWSCSPDIREGTLM